MICFVVGQGTNRFMVSEFFHEYMPKASLDRLRFVDAEYLETRVWPDAKVWVFIGLDQQPNRIPLIQIENELRGAGKIVLNMPSRVIPRYELSKVLTAAGINAFDVHASDSDPDTWKFPVFARFRRRHEGTSPLLYSAEDVERVLNQNPALGTHEGMIVEFVETKSPVDELYRKYSVIRIGRRYVPRHILFSRHWHVKTEDVITIATALEETNWHEQPVPPEIVTAFEVAGIEYGRIDYSYLGDRPQIWEINVNPVINLRPSSIHPLRADAQAVSAKRTCAAFDELLAL